MIYLLYILHILVCLFLILVVLLQQGKGADLSVFGGGSTQTAFGARGAATVLHKLTVGSFVAFIFTTVFIAAFQHQDTGGSVIGDDVEVPAAEQTLPADEADDAVTGDEVEQDAVSTPASDDTGAVEGDAVESNSVESDSAPADDAGDTEDPQQ